MAASTTPRFGNPPNNDNSGRTISQRFLSPVYAASIALNPTEKETTVVVGTLTGNLALSAIVTNSFAADELTVLFTSDASIRTITFGAGFSVSVATLATVASKKASITFTFDGALYVETGRCIGI